MHQCRGCGADVPANAPLGHCPKCLLQLGFGLEQEKTSSPAAATDTRVFGDYELLEQIGRGGMGVIYKARQITLNRLVALKMVNAGELATPTMIQRFHLEAEAAANLHHPNIVPIYETGEHEGQHFFSMELVNGVGLDRHIKRGGFDGDQRSGREKSSTRARQEQIARITAKVACAVNYAHQRGVLHRDIKPSNVLLDSRGEPRLTDFGVAKVAGHTGSGLTASGAIMGTPSYMAPEQAAGQGKRVTTAADIYSLGAVLYAMLTGHPPFHAETPVQTLKQVVEDEPKHPTTFGESIDHDLATICMKCLEKEPQQRYSSATALADDLERWLRHEPIHARPAGTGERFWRWCRRNPKVATLGGSVLLLLVTLAVGATAVAIRIKALNDDMERKNQLLLASNDDKESNNRELRKELQDDLINLYADENAKPVFIPSARRRTLFGKRPVTGVPLELKFVEHLYVHPTNMLTTLAPILDYLEENLSRRLQIPVAIHMYLFKTPSGTYQAVESTNLTFGRMGPASYVSLEDRSNGVRMLAAQDHKKPLTLALFARTNSEVARLAASRTNIPLAELLAELLAKRSLALTHSNSTTGNYMAKRFLAKSGVFATNLSRYDYLGSQSKVSDAVLAGEYDVGAGNLDLVDNNPAFCVIAKFEVPNLGRCWIAGKGVDGAMEERLRACLLELRDPAILAKLESEVSGFKTLDQAALERLRVIMRESAAFDEGRNPATP